MWKRDMSEKEGKERKMKGKNLGPFGGQSSNCGSLDVGNLSLVCINI
jgi:hypothetical protein